MAESVRKVLVVGATGKQGRSVIKHLLLQNDIIDSRDNTTDFETSPAPPPSHGKFHILALTRNVTSPSAKSLKAQYQDNQFVDQVDQTRSTSEI